MLNHWSRLIRRLLVTCAALAVAHNAVAESFNVLMIGNSALVSDYNNDPQEMLDLTNLGYDRIRQNLPTWDHSDNVVDLGLLRTVFFNTGDLDADFNGDGVVNVIDLATMRIGFFGMPGPSGLVP